MSELEGKWYKISFYYYSQKPLPEDWERILASALNQAQGGSGWTIDDARVEEVR